jgi:hypothetical protein
LQQQINVTDNVSRIVGAHQIKLGLDYRRHQLKGHLLILGGLPANCISRSARIDPDADADSGNRVRTLTRGNCAARHLKHVKVTVAVPRIE